MRPAISSVLSQTHRNLEFLIMDDGSSDETVRILTELAARDSRIRLFKNEKNRGTGYCYSFLIARAKGKYLASIGQDDIWDTDFLHKSLQALEQNPLHTASFTPVNVIDSQGNPRPTTDAPFRYDIATQLSHADLLCILLKHNLICSVSGVFRTDKIQNWRTLGDNDQLQDWETWLHLLIQGPFLFLPEELIRYRIHGSNLSMGGHSSMQASLELMHTRASILSSEAFAKFVLSHPHPSSFFKAALTAVAESIDPQDESHYFILLYALKANQHLLRELPSYQAVMGMLYQHGGALHKSGRYADSEGVFSDCPRPFWTGFRWHYLIALAPAVESNPSFPFIRLKKVGPLRVMKVLLKRKALFKVNFAINRTAKSAGKLIESHLANRKLTLKKKVSIFLHSSGMGPAIIMAKTLRRKLLNG